MARAMVTCVCDQCGETFYRTIGDMNARKRRGATKSFCTRKCYLASQGTRTKLTCDQCSQSFSRATSNALLYENHFCSRDCYLQFVATKYVTQQCHGCGTAFERPEAQERTRRKEGLDRTFCSFECYKKYSSNRVTVTCDACGTQFEKQGKSVRGRLRHFCSRRCQHNAHAAVNIIRQCEVCGVDIEEPAWYKVSQERRGAAVTYRKYCSMRCTGKAKLVPESHLEYSREFRKQIRYLVLERDSYTCRECGAPQEDTSHHIHHIDYNKLNDNLDNLITLCPSCHTKTTGAGPDSRQKWIEYYQKKVATLIQ